MDFTEIVAAFTTSVNLFRTLLSQKADALKYGAACRTFAAAIGTETIMVEGNPVNAAGLTAVVNYFDSLTSGEDEARISLVKQANFLEVALEAGTMVPEDETASVKAALAAWQDVSTTKVEVGGGRGKARQLRAAS